MLKFNPRKIKKNKGFTLMEILVVSLIIAVVAAIAYPLYTKSILKARAAEAVNLLEIVRAKQLSHYVASREYYNTFENIGRLTQKGGPSGKEQVQADKTKIQIGDYELQMLDNNCLTVTYPIPQGNDNALFEFTVNYDKTGLACTGTACSSFGDITTLTTAQICNVSDLPCSGGKQRGTDGTCSCPSGMISSGDLCVECDSPGTSRSCTDSEGRQGYQTCKMNYMWGPCLCSQGSTVDSGCDAKKEKICLQDGSYSSCQCKNQYSCSANKILDDNCNCVCDPNRAAACSANGGQLNDNCKCSCIGSAALRQKCAAGGLNWDINNCRCQSACDEAERHYCVQQDSIIDSKCGCQCEGQLTTYNACIDNLGTWDMDNCSCTDGESCPEPEKQSCRYHGGILNSNCGCECQFKGLDEYDPCIQAGGTWDMDNCSCNSTCEQEKIKECREVGGILNSYCDCKCQDSSGDYHQCLLDGKSWDIQTCSCVRCSQAQGQKCANNNMVINPNDCSCSCYGEVVAYTDCLNDGKNWDMNNCTCVEACPSGKQWDITTNKCECSNGQDKINCNSVGGLWKDDICSCICPRALEWDANTNRCICPASSQARCGGNNIWTANTCACQCHGEVWDPHQNKCITCGLGGSKHICEAAGLDFDAYHGDSDGGGGCTCKCPTGQTFSMLHRQCI